MQYETSKYTLCTGANRKGYLANTFTRTSVILAEPAYQLAQHVFNLLDSGQPIPEQLQPVVPSLAAAGFIVPAGTDEYAAAIDRFQTERTDGSILSLVVAPTMACNMDCFYCYEDKNTSRIDSPLRELICAFATERLADGGILEVKWHGGEPLLEKLIIYTLSEQLMSLADRKRARYTSSMISNCYLLDEETARRLSEYKVQSIQVTFDGSHEDHDRIRFHLNPRTERRCPSFATIVANVRSASQLVRIIARVNVYQGNIEGVKTLLDELADAGLAQRVADLYFSPIFNYRASSRSRSYEPIDDVHLAVQDFSAIETDLQRHALGLGFPLWDMLKGPHSGCIAVHHNGFVVDADGDLKKCYHDLGNHKAAFSSLVSRGQVFPGNLEKWLTFRPEADPECRQCELFPLCYAACPHKAFSGALREEICPTFKYNWRTSLPLMLESGQRRTSHG